MLATQGRLRGLLRANAAVAADLSLPVLLRHIVDAARNLLRARYAAVGVNGRGGQLQQFVQAGRLLDADDSVVGEVATFLRDLLAAGKTASTLRSFGMDLLRWWRFLTAVDVRWNRATRVEARAFSCWIQLTSKPRRPSLGPMHNASSPR